MWPEVPCAIADAWGEDKTLSELTAVLDCEGLGCCTGIEACMEAGTLGEPWFDMVVGVGGGSYALKKAEIMEDRITGSWMLNAGVGRVVLFFNLKV